MQNGKFEGFFLAASFVSVCHRMEKIVSQRDDNKKVAYLLTIWVF